MHHPTVLRVPQLTICLSEQKLFTVTFSSNMPKIIKTIPIALYLVSSNLPLAFMDRIQL